MQNRKRLHSFENARKRARQAGEALLKNHNWEPLHGLPITIKECIEVAGFQHDHTDLFQCVTKFNDQDLDHLDVMTPWAVLSNIAFLPATVAPVGTTSGGLPVGVQIIGPYLEDRTPIHVAKLMKEILGGFTPPPDFA